MHTSRRRAGATAAVLTAAATAFSVSSGAANAASAPVPLHRPMAITHSAAAHPGRKATVYTSNWAGYVADSGTYSQVVADWTQPTLTCPSGATTSSAYWVGIDGYSSTTIEQTGVEADCDSGTASYYAWFDSDPADPLETSFGGTVKPGDQLVAQVSASGDVFTYLVEDKTQGWTVTQPVTASGAAKSSAEIILEAPSDDNGNVLPLADFGTVDFTGTEADSTALSSLSTAPLQLDMSTEAGVAEATSSALSGSAFSVTWDSE